MSKPLRPIPPSLAAHCFKPGQSGNPSGNKGAQYAQVVALARDASFAATQRLIELMRSDDERVAMVACNAILDRAWGKPKETPPTTPPGRVLNLSALSDQQIDNFRQILIAMRDARQQEADDGEDEA